MISASEEMHDEKVQFSELIEHLNKVLEPRGIELKRVKWNPETDGSIEDFKNKISDCEMCLTLYWHDLAGNSEQEMNTAYEELKEGNNPRKLYVFFKEPAEIMSTALKDFKLNFVSNYGHFFCKFENVDTMNLHFILQLESYPNIGLSYQDEFVSINNGIIMVGGKEFVCLDKVHFAARNLEYQNLQKELERLDKQISEIKARNHDGSYSKELEVNMSKRNDLADELKMLQYHLYDIALNFAKYPENMNSNRMQKARELFEKGNVAEADALFDMKQIEIEDDLDKKLITELRNKRESRIKDLILAAKFAITNTTKTESERFSKARDEYENAISIAKEINYSDDKYADLIFEYAFMLNEFKRFDDAIRNYTESFNIYQKLLQDNQVKYLPRAASTANNIATLQHELSRYSLAESNYQFAVQAFRKLSLDSPDLYFPKLARSLNNLAYLYVDMDEDKKAEQLYIEALEIFRQLEISKSGQYLLDIAQIQINLGNLNRKLQQYEDAEIALREAQDILNRLSLDSPNLYLKEKSLAFIVLADIQVSQNRISDADSNYHKAIDAYRKLAKDNPMACQPELSIALSKHADFLCDCGKYEDAEKEYLDALVLCNKLSEHQPESYLPRKALVLHNLAMLMAQVGRYDDAIAYQKDVVSILKDFSHDACLPQFANSLKHLAIYLTDVQNFNEAKEILLKALEIYKQLEENNPGVYVEQIYDIWRYLK